MHIQLIPSSLDHAHDYFRLFSSTEVCRYMDILPFHTLADAERFLAFAQGQFNNKKSIRYTILADQNFAGTACLYSIYWHQKRASLGYALCQDQWRKGIMSQVIDQLAVLAKNDLGLNRLQATVLQENQASSQLLLKKCFAKEGLLRQYEIWAGRGFVDLELYARIL